MNPYFMPKLLALREAWGKPLVINSAYRCKLHNEAEGGKPKSLHLHGRAVDIAFADSEEREEFIALAKTFGFNGIGRGANFLHIDDRAVGAEWTY